MGSPVSWQQKLNFFLTTGGLYLGTICFVYYIVVAAIVTPILPPHIATTVIEQPKKSAPPPVKQQPEFVLISGKPVRLVVPASGIDLPVDEGYYNDATGTWTLSSSHAQFAMMTLLANNHSGNTFIYGHGTDRVLGQLISKPPTIGSIAEIYTDNGHVFTYTFQSSRDMTPTDTSVFSYSGPPILTIQTCTGPVSEWRTMYQFAFNKVV